jgi:hypothetical protein
LVDSLPWFGLGIVKIALKARPAGFQGIHLQNKNPGLRETGAMQKI